ncbi:MAG: lytic transglycosylase domain-containing protein [Gammaproteobacteria bacterium]
MVSASFHLKISRFFGAAFLLVYSLCLPVRGAEVVIPLTIPFDFLTMGMIREHNPLPEDATIIRYKKGCSNLSLDHPRFGRQGRFVRFVSHGTGSAGIDLFGTCLNPVNWRGYIEILATPSVTADWQLHLSLDHSNLYDEAWQKGLLMGPIWEAAQDLVLPSVTGFTVNLTPPRDETLSLLRTFVPSARIRQVDAIFRSAAAKAIQVDDHGVNVDLSLMLPDNLQQKAPASAGSVSPLSPEELKTVQHALEQWDAFLVFVVKDIGGHNVDPFIRDQLFDLLLDSRYEVLPILAGEDGTREDDPVRTLFIETWSRLQEIVRSAEEKGIELNNALRYAAFIRAGNVLLTVDRAAPGFGLEISSDGLRRLARILQPELKEDPLIYNLEPDPALRELFGLPAPLPEEEPLEPEPEDVDPLGSLLDIFKSAHAGDLPEKAGLAVLKERLNRWAPKASEFNEYRSLMDELLQLTTDRKVRTSKLASRHKSEFINLVRATALKESCWKQFVRKKEKVTYLRSSAGSIGLMQINPYVWRGFYNLDQLKWNVPYNAEAGAEILLHYWQRYAVSAEKNGHIDNIARSTYAIYNAGPAAAGRYRKKSSSRREKKVDNRFWEMYQGFKANEEVDLFRCTVRPG